MKNAYFHFVLFLMVPVLVFSQSLDNIDEIAPFNDGIAAVRKGKQWGFINTDGVLVIDFRDDLHWNTAPNKSSRDITGTGYPVFKEGRCIVKKMVDEIPIYGFIDTKGNLVIDYQFLNVSNFNNGYTTGVVFDKVFRGNNEFNLKIYDYKFHDVLMDLSGEIVEFFDRRYNIQMTKRRYQLPKLGAKLLADNLIALRTKENGWKIRTLQL
ncbi:WG repeat-containing protein [Spongiimicrobium sp. 3-5]|uniref:WG repeat-containing protein n=1 Tax=Spongiimicrobium sp. 3-5 TaxID=3332596 RepID=UPI00397F24E2